MDHFVRLCDAAGNNAGRQSGDGRFDHDGEEVGFAMMPTLAIQDLIQRET